ncbi:hypothetical protein ACFL47_03285 [Candidatus Latescibacterota bacterium]
MSGYHITSIISLAFSVTALYFAYQALSKIKTMEEIGGHDAKKQSGKEVKANPDLTSNITITYNPEQKRLYVDNVGRFTAHELVVFLDDENIFMHPDIEEILT